MDSVLALSTVLSRCGFRRGLKYKFLARDGRQVLQEKTNGFLLLSLRPHVLPLYFNLSCTCVISSTNKRDHGPNKAFLVPDSCRATERKGYSISSDVTDDTIE